MGLILLMEEMLYHLLSMKLYEKFRNSPYQLVIAGYLNHQQYFSSQPSLSPKIRGSVSGFCVCEHVDHSPWFTNANNWATGV